jgi:hypothetical protein
VHFAFTSGKALSDSGSNVTILVVGVADSVTDLIERHQSIERCTEQIQMPRMAVDERREVLEKRLGQLGMAISGDGRWKIINLSKGLPAYVHALGKFAVFSALGEGRINVTEADVDSAINQVLQSSQQTLKDAYEAATRSNQARAQFRHVLTACALARVDDGGYFMPASVSEPLANILKRPVEIANFQNAQPKRKKGLGIPIAGSIPLFMVGVVICLFFATAIGIFLGTVIHSMQQLGLLFMLVYLPMNMLSGSNTPLESMPPWLATIMEASPSTHFVSFAQSILYRGAGLDVVWPQFLVVALIGGLFLAWLSGVSALWPPSQRNG